MIEQSNVVQAQPRIIITAKRIRCGCGWKHINNELNPDFSRTKFRMWKGFLSLLLGARPAFCPNIIELEDLGELVNVPLSEALAP